MSEIEQAIKHFEGLQKRYTTQHNGAQCELVKTALSALREKLERENPQPLTLDELREMVGEPVYIAFARHEFDGWTLSCDAQDYIDEVERKGATAYRYPPKEGDKL